MKLPKDSRQGNTAPMFRVRWDWRDVDIEIDGGKRGGGAVEGKG